MKDAVRLLDQLCYGRQFGTEGQLFLANVADSCDLMPPRAMLQFLKDLARYLEKHPNDSFLTARRAVSKSLSGRGRPKYLRLARQRRTGLDRHTLHSTVEWHVFLEHCRKDGELPEGIPMAEPPVDGSELRRAVSVVQLVTAMPGWHAPDATLGRPEPEANCWLAADGVTELEVNPRYSGRTTVADQVRDKLGLVHHGEGVHLVSYRFSGESLTSMRNVELARPTVADFGNSRFRVQPNCNRSRDLSARGWGCTVHLALLPQARRKTISGSAERVACALPLTQLSSLEVRYLTVTTRARGRGARDNDKAFLRVLLGNRSLLKLKEKVLRHLRGAEI